MYPIASCHQLKNYDKFSCQKILSYHYLASGISINKHTKTWTLHSGKTSTYITDDDNILENHRTKEIFLFSFKSKQFLIFNTMMNYYK